MFFHFASYFFFLKVGKLTNSLYTFIQLKLDGDVLIDRDALKYGSTANTDHKLN